MIYTEITTDFGVKLIVKDNSDGSFSYIPYDDKNSDYQDYLRWLENQA